MKWLHQQRLYLERQLYHTGGKTLDLGFDLASTRNVHHCEPYSGHSAHRAVHRRSSPTAYKSPHITLPIPLPPPPPPPPPLSASHTRPHPTLRECKAGLAMRCARRPAYVATVEAGDVQTRLRELLDWLQFWKAGDLDALSPGARRSSGMAARDGDDDDDKGDDASLRDGALSWLKFWQGNEGNARRTAEQLRDAGMGLKEGNLDVVRERTSMLDFSWLFPSKTPSAPTSDDDAGVIQMPGRSPARTVRGEFVEIEERLAQLGAFVAEALCPWDYDRRELSLTFANSWTDVSPSRVARGKEAIVKITSTIKPLYQEWKLSARTMLMPLGEGGVLFGKAGLFLAGDAPAYVGLEADKVLDVPRLKGTKVFANANYRSSRKPFAAPVVASLGVQQTVPVNKRLEFTFRFGISTKNSTRAFFISPVPYGTYF